MIITVNEIITIISVVLILFASLTLINSKNKFLRYIGFIVLILDTIVAVITYIVKSCE